MKCIDFYYDYGSPTAYLAWTQLFNLPDNKYKVSFIPVLLGGIFKATDNKPPGQVINKAKWMFKDISMYADKYQVEFNMNDAFPVNTLYLMRGAVYANKVNLLEKYNTVMFKAMWVENINLNDPKNIISVLKNNGFISKDFLEATEDQTIKEALKNNTSKAVDIGIFGVPSFIVNGELYFGQDRMEWFIN